MTTLEALIRIAESVSPTMINVQTMIGVDNLALLIASELVKGTSVDLKPANVGKGHRP